MQERIVVERAPRALDWVVALERAQREHRELAYRPPIGFTERGAIMTAVTWARYLTA